MVHGITETRGQKKQDKPKMIAKVDIPKSPSAEQYSAEADQGDVFTAKEPLALFADWFEEAKKYEPNDPGAFTLATVDAAGMPDCRVILLKDLSDAGFSFYTNSQSTKGLQLAQRPVAAMCFFWKSIRRQVRVRGMVSEISDAECDAYFATRARMAQIGAWASQQSRELSDGNALKARIAELEAEFDGKDVPRPPHWRGYLIAPQSMEFWVNRPFRLHDRVVYSRKGDGTDDGWREERLYP
jgi:pyridoxamine 5'-phosphate oxidase